MSKDYATPAYICDDKRAISCPKKMCGHGKSPSACMEAGKCVLTTRENWAQRWPDGKPVMEDQAELLKQRSKGGRLRLVASGRTPGIDDSSLVEKVRVYQVTSMGALYDLEEARCNAAEYSMEQLVREDLGIPEGELFAAELLDGGYVFVVRGEEMGE